MDKHGQRITIKINGSERPFSTKKKELFLKPAETEVCATSEKNSSIEWEEEKKETAANAKNIVHITELREITSSKKKQKWKQARGGKSLKSAVLSILTAVFVGTSLGFIILNFVLEQREGESLQEVSGSYPSLENKKDDTATDPSQGTPPLTEQSSLLVHVIQAGAYSSSKAAADYGSSLKKSGVPVMTFGENPTYIFVGIGTEKDALQPIGEQLVERVQGTYIKPLTINATADQQITKVLKNSHPFYEQLIASSVSLLKGSSINEQEWKKLENQYKKFEALEIPKDRAVINYAEHLKNAYTLLGEYAKTKDGHVLWSVQQELLFALKNYLSLANE